MAIMYNIFSGGMVTAARCNEQKQGLDIFPPSLKRVQRRRAADRKCSRLLETKVVKGSQGVGKYRRR